MYLKQHGGSCCGMSHIFGFVGPNHDLQAIKSLDQAVAADVHSSPPGSYARANYAGRRIVTEIPAETCLERLDRYLAFIDRAYSNHMVEVVLNSNQLNNWPQWPALLRKRGFKKVFDGRNSNSTRVCTIFIRATDDRFPQRTKLAKAAVAEKKETR